MSNAVQKLHALWYHTLLGRALQETDDLGEAIMAADMALAIKPIPDEKDVFVERNGKKIEPPEEAHFSYDIVDKEAQGILNRAVNSFKRYSKQARRQLKEIFAKGSSQEAARKIVDFVARYRNQLADFLSATQLASILTGALEVARRVPSALSMPGSGVALPPSLPPEDAASVIESIRKLSKAERDGAIYQLPADQQAYVRQAVEKEIGEPLPSFTPPAPPEGSIEYDQWPIVEAAVRQLSQKNVVTREVFDRLDDASRAKSFTVANVAARETLEKIRDVLALNAAQGVDYEDFRDTIVDQVEPGTFLSDAHMEQVFRNNIGTGFSDGRMEVAKHPFVRSGFPYAQVSAIHDDRVRDTHLAVEKLGIQGTRFFRIDDPVFEMFRGPWDYGCRCGWMVSTIRNAADHGIEEAKQWLATGVEPDPKAFVSMPSFRPSPSFVRPSSPSLMLSLESLDNWSKKRKGSLFLQAVTEITPSPLVSQGSGWQSTVGDHAPDHPRNLAKSRTRSKGKDKGKKGKGERRKLRRRLGASLRTPKRWGMIFSVESIPAEPEHVGVCALPEAAPDKIGVVRDWDTLKSVILGIPDHDVLPSWYPDWDEPEGNEVGGPETAGMLKSEVDPKKFAGAVEQMNAFAELLEKEGVTVYRSPVTPLDFARQFPVGLASMWPREEFTIIGNCIIQNQTRAAHRNKERVALEPFITALAEKSGAKIYRPPCPEDFNMDTGWKDDKRYFIEGGDIHRLGKDVLVGCSYLTSSPNGIKWLQEVLEPDGVKVWTVRTTKDWFHMDYIFAAIREGLYMAYLPGFKEGVPEPLKDWDVVEVTKEEADGMHGANGIALRSGVMLLPKGSKRVVKALEKKNVDVIEVEYEDVTFWQGAIDCSTTEICRESAVP